MDAGAVPEAEPRVIQDALALAVHARLPLPELLTLMFWLGVVNPLAPKNVSEAGVVARMAVFTPRVTGITSGELVAPGMWMEMLPVYVPAASPVVFALTVM